MVRAPYSCTCKRCMVGKEEETSLDMESDDESLIMESDSETSLIMEDLARLVEMKVKNNQTEVFGMLDFEITHKLTQQEMEQPWVFECDWAAPAYLELFMSH